MLRLDDAGTATLTPLGLSVTGQALTAAEIDAVSALFATSAAPPVPAGTGRYADLAGGDLLAERHLAPPDTQPVRARPPAADPHPPARGGHRTGPATGRRDRAARR